MPEFYAEPLKDWRACSVCQGKRTETGSKVLLTCFKCHAITYCGRECQIADWGRHEWNCHPVMVKEFPGKGRGLVAARDIEKGEVIFLDKPVIKLALNAERRFTDPEFMMSLKQQIESLPAEARKQFDKLKTCDVAHNSFGNLSSSDKEVLKKFLQNSMIYYKEDLSSWLQILHLNLALVNHSCLPNATNRSTSKQLQQEGEEDQSKDLRAIQEIRKGEEITICYVKGVEKFGSNLKKRRPAFKKDQGFDCKCPVCLGQVPLQEKTLKKLVEAHNKLNPTPSDWKREAGIWSWIVDLRMELNIGDPIERIWVFDKLLRFAHLARDKNLVRKAKDMWRQFTEETKNETYKREFEDFERVYEMWSVEFSSTNAPKKIEIDYILGLASGDRDVNKPI